MAFINTVKGITWLSLNWRLKCVHYCSRHVSCFTNTPCNRRFGNSSSLLSTPTGLTCWDAFDFSGKRKMPPGTQGFSTSSLRWYAKGKDKKKSDKGKKSKVIINENEMGELIDVEEMRQQMKEKVDILIKEYVTQLALRTSTGALESLIVEIDGQEYPLQEVVQIARKNPQLVVINMAALPQATVNVMKALHESGMNINPQQDGTTIYVPVPKVTTDHREKLARNAKTLFLKCREDIRKVESNYSKTASKPMKGISEDLVFSVLQQVKAVADTFIAEAENMMQTKQNELLGKS